MLHHAKWLSENLPSTSAVFTVYPFRNYSDVMKIVTIVSGITSPVLNGNGIPPHVQTWLNESEILTLIADLPKKILDSMDGVLERNGVNAGNITRGVLETMMRNLLETDRQNRNLPSSAPQPEIGVYQAHLWKDGMFHKLPEDFQLPDSSVLSGWLMWWEGIHEKNIPPLSSVGTFDIPKHERHRFSNLQCLIKYLLDVLPPNQYQKFSTAELTAIGQEGIKQLSRKTHKKSVRWSEWKVSTALREARQGLIEKDPSRKRIIVRPSKRQKKRSSTRADVSNK